MMRCTPAASLLTWFVLLHSGDVYAQQWTEMKSANFVVTSSAGASPTRTLAWQLEQVRHAIGALFAWARVDLDRPIAVYAAKDERTMRLLAPEYWEQRGGIRPASVWVSAPDRYYFAIRADLRAEDKDNVNPHVTAYHAYASLILQHSAARELPLWFSEGFAGVLSNTIVRDTYILFGPPIPWHLERLREGPRLRLLDLMNATRASPHYTNTESRYRFDAQSWALVHFLIFSDKGVRRPKLDRFIRLVSGGLEPEAAGREAFGDLKQMERDFLLYVGQSLFPYLRVDLEASVKRESFPVRPLSAPDAAAALAMFHVAMDRQSEANAAIADARRGAPAPADSFVAEALLLDREGKRDEARDAFEQGVAAGSQSGYAHYRLAALRWKPDADRDTLGAMEKLLLRAVALNARHPPSNGFLGEVRSRLGGEGLPFVRRAIMFAPAEPEYRLSAARILMRAQKYDEALQEAQTALALSRTEEYQRGAKSLIAAIEAARAR